MTSWRHVMTSQNLIYLSQLVDVLESCFFFCFHGYSGHWVWKCYWFFSRVMKWRHDVMSWRHKTNLPISACRCARKLILFFLSMSFLVTEFKNVIDFLFVWWRDVMTSCHDVRKPDLLISACRYVLERCFFFCFHVFFRSLSSNMLLILHLCDAAMSWRHVMTSLNLIYLSQLVSL